MTSLPQPAAAMSWTMPRPVLQWVAGLMALGAAGSFALGVINAPDRGGRLPGERAAGQAGSATVINATEATPLSQERIEGPPPPVEKPATNSTDEEEGAATNTITLPPAAAVNATKPTGAVNAVAPQPDRVGDILQQQAPPPEEPPH